MATERLSVTTQFGSLAKWVSWLAAVAGLWAVASPFVLSESLATAPELWSVVAAGVLIAVLAGYGAYAVRTAAEMEANSPHEFAGWIAAVAGVWIAVSPFALTETVGADALTWSNVVAGVLAVVLAAYVGYFLHSRA